MADLDQVLQAALAQQETGWNTGIFGAAAGFCIRTTEPDLLGILRQNAGLSRRIE